MFFSATAVYFICTFCYYWREILVERTVVVQANTDVGCCYDLLNFCPRSFEDAAESFHKVTGASPQGTDPIPIMIKEIDAAVHF